MNLGDTRSLFKSWLDRDDCTDAQALQFLKLGVARIQRELRVPSMEKVHITLPEAELKFIVIPIDFLEVKEILWNGKELKRASSTADIYKVPSGASPSLYYRLNDRILIAGSAGSGDEVVLVYYGAFEDMPTDVDENSLFAFAPDLACLAALTFAGDFFQHDKLETWEGRYQDTLGKLNQQAIDEAFSGGTMQVHSPYGDCTY